MPSAAAMRGALLLLFAALLWGLGFYAQRVSIESTPPLLACAWRFLVAMPLAVGVIALRRRRGVPIPWRAGIVLGVLLYVAFALQTTAMLYTPVSRVALITGLYAVLTPLLQPLFGLRRPNLLQLVAVATAMLGTALLCGVTVDDPTLRVPPNVGDALTLIMAFVAAVLVLFIARFAGRDDALALNAVQILTMGICAVVCAPLVEGLPHALPDARTWASLLYLAVASTFIAFQCQLVGQRDVSPAAAGVLMLVETPIGVIAAVLLLDEQMQAAQWMGAALAVVAVVVAVAAEPPSADPQIGSEAAQANAAEPPAPPPAARS
jgi:drug/metabolite transporter (DMT)-like permease